MEEYRKYEPIFGAWYLKRLLGRGSFGKVFEITREEFGTTYRAALKIISIPQDEDDIRMRMTEGSDAASVSAYYEDVLKDIVNENEIMAQLKGNSNIVSYEDHQIIPHEDGIGYDILIRMELLTPLLERMIEKKLSEREVVRLGTDMCKALELCHRKNIIHRDIKPQNIFISDSGDFKLGDFGIARTMEKTVSGMSRKGTYKYMAPEVFRGEHYDSTADIYSLGIVLYSLLNDNRGPFLPGLPARVTPADEEAARDRRLRGETFPDPKDAGPVLSYIIRKACAFDPKDRYRTAEEMRLDLESYSGNYSIDGFEEDGEKTIADPAMSGKGTASFRRTDDRPEWNGSSRVSEHRPQTAAVPQPQAYGAYEQKGYPQPREIGKTDNKSSRFILIGVIAVLAVAVAALSAVLLLKPDKAEEPETAAVQESETQQEVPAAESTPEEEDVSVTETASEDYPAYNDYGYHTFYFDTEGGSGDFAPIDVEVNTSFNMPSSVPSKDGSTFAGWYVERLSDGKWYCKDSFTWIDWDGSGDEGIPYLYEPGISLLYDDSWEKTGGSGDSNYVFHAVWE